MKINPLPLRVLPLCRGRASREKQIETVLTNVSGIQGSLQGCLGPKQLPGTGLEELEGLGE